MPHFRLLPAPHPQPLCGACEENYGRVGSACSKCPERWLNSVYYLAVLLGNLVLLLATIRATIAAFVDSRDPAQHIPNFSQLIKIALNFALVTGFCARVEAGWPKAIDIAFRAEGSAADTTEAFSLDCSIQWYERNIQRVFYNTMVVYCASVSLVFLSPGLILLPKLLAVRCVVLFSNSCLRCVLWPSGKRSCSTHRHGPLSWFLLSPQDRAWAHDVNAALRFHEWKSRDLRACAVRLFLPPPAQAGAAVGGATDAGAAGGDGGGGGGGAGRGGRRLLQTQVSMLAGLQTSSPAARLADPVFVVPWHHQSSGARQQPRTENRLSHATQQQQHRSTVGASAAGDRAAHHHHEVSWMGGLANAELSQLAAAAGLPPPPPAAPRGLRATAHARASFLLRRPLESDTDAPLEPPQPQHAGGVLHPGDEGGPALRRPHHHPLSPLRPSDTTEQPLRLAAAPEAAAAAADDAPASAAAAGAAPSVLSAAPPAVPPSLAGQTTQHHQLQPCMQPSTPSRMNPLFQRSAVAAQQNTAPQRQSSGLDSTAGAALAALGIHQGGEAHNNQQKRVTPSSVWTSELQAWQNVLNAAGGGGAGAAGGGTRLLLPSQPGALGSKRTTNASERGAALLFHYPGGAVASSGLAPTIGPAESMDSVPVGCAGRNSAAVRVHRSPLLFFKKCEPLSALLGHEVGLLYPSPLEADLLRLTTLERETSQPALKRLTTGLSEHHPHVDHHGRLHADWRAWFAARAAAAAVAAADLAGSSSAKEGSNNINSAAQSHGGKQGGDAADPTGSAASPVGGSVTQGGDQSADPPTDTQQEHEQPLVAHLAAELLLSTFDDDDDSALRSLALGQLIPVTARDQALEFLVGLRCEGHPGGGGGGGGGSHHHGGGGSAAKRFADVYIVSIICIAFFCWSPVASALLSLFSCVPVNTRPELDPAGPPVQGSLLVVDMRHTCWSGVHARFAYGLGIPGVLITLVGTPIFIVAVNVWHRDSLDDPQLLRRFGFLFLGACCSGGASLFPPCPRARRRCSAAGHARNVA